MSIPRVVIFVRKEFRSCLKDKRLDCISNLYHKKAVLKGSFAKKPVIGHELIQKYFEKFFKDVNDVKFDKNPIIFEKNKLVFVSGKYDFSFDDGRKVRATYQFVLEDDKILTHFSAVNEWY
jgi:hypothetical protein